MPSANDVLDVVPMLEDPATSTETTDHILQTGQ